jgi:hypothetical protein
MNYKTYIIVMHTILGFKGSKSDKTDDLFLNLALQFCTLILVEADS